MNYQSILNFVVGCMILWASCNSPLNNKSKEMHAQYSKGISTTRTANTTETKININELDIDLKSYFYNHQVDFQSTDQRDASFLISKTY